MRVTSKWLILTGIIAACLIARKLFLCAFRSDLCYLNLDIPIAELLIPLTAILLYFLFVGFIYLITLMLLIGLIFHSWNAPKVWALMVIGALHGWVFVLLVEGLPFWELGYPTEAVSAGVCGVIIILASKLISINLGWLAQEI